MADANILIKNLTKAVKDYSSIQAERSKIKGDMFINAIKAKQNFFFKQQEQAMKQKGDPAYQAQKALAERYKGQQPVQTTDPFGAAQPRVTATPSGFKEETPKLSKEFIYRRIQNKKGRGMELTEREKKYEEDYLGLEGKDPSELLKEEKATEELRMRAGARQPLDTKIPQRIEGGWFGIGGKDINEATTNFAKTIKTRQDLIAMIKNADALEEQGVDISELETLYEDELLKLATEGYLSEK